MGFQDFAYPPSVDYSFLVDAQLEIALNVLVNSVAASSTLNDWDDVFVDIFSDADGADNTLDTGNTTAGFDTGNTQYVNSTYTAGPQTDAHGLTLASPASTTKYCGFRIHTAKACTLTKITRTSTCTGTTAYLLDSSKSILATTTSLAGDEFTFTDYDLAADTTYYVAVGIDESSSYNRTYHATPSYPYNKVNINYTGGLNDNAPHLDVDNRAYNVEDVITKDAYGTPANKIVQTNALTNTANPDAHQVYAHTTTTGTGAVTYDISFDNGSTYITGQALNQKNEGSHAGTQMIMKLNLNGAGAGNMAKAKDYGILLFY